MGKALEVRVLGAQETIRYILTLDEVVMLRDGLDVLSPEDGPDEEEDTARERLERLQVAFSVLVNELEKGDT